MPDFIYQKAPFFKASEGVKPPLFQFTPVNSRVKPKKDGKVEV
jgi:hypothetical protein